MFEMGQQVRIREQVWEVIEDRVAGGSEDHLLQVQGIEDENRGVRFTFVYHPGTEQTETPGAGVEHVTPEKVPDLPWQPDSLPSAWERLHTAYRLSIAHRADRLLSLARARLVIEPYQLEPVLRIMNAPRQRFLLAEDVGMGKTIEAGLVMMELMARGRADRILVIVPASLQDQWSDELFDKFGLQFQILDNEALTNMLPGLKAGANPWNYSNHVITSIDFAKRERISHALKNSYWDLVIVDEAHYLSESGTASKRGRTVRSRFGEMIAGTCDSLLLLTATPHNGYAQGFYSLLHLLDDTRFPSPEQLNRETVQQVMIRRSKNDIYERDGVTHKFIKRVVTPLPLLITDPQMEVEWQFHLALLGYANRRWQAAGERHAQRVVIGFTMTLLKKRFISSPHAIRLSLQRRWEKLGTERVDSKAALFQSSSRGLPRTDRENQHIEDVAMAQTTARTEPELVQERQEIEHLLRLAEQITPEKDYKASTLRAKLDEFRAQGRKVIVFTEYKDTLDYLYTYLSERGYAGQLVTLHGDMSRTERISAEQRFQERDVWVLLATDAASEGLNFQRDCYTVIHNELPWNPNRLEQRNGRVDRWGQHQQVEIFNIVLEGTLESHIQRRLAEKLENIRNDIGKTSDVLSSSDVLSIAEEIRLEDLEERLMDVSAELGDNPTQEAFAKMTDRLDSEIDERVERARQQQLEWQANMNIARNLFQTEQYQEIELHKRETEAQIPHDEQLEIFVRECLEKSQGRAEPLPGDEAIWRLEIPPSLRTQGVKAAYERATFSSAVARGHLERRGAPDYLEFISLGHPLLESLIAQVKVDARQNRGQLAGRMALRVLDEAEPGMLFTFLARWQDGRGRIMAEEVVPLFLSLASRIWTPAQAKEEAERLLALKQVRRNVPVELANTRYQPHWPALREQARELARAWCQQQASRVGAERLSQVTVLERDLTTWAQAREQWVAQQQERKLDQEKQMELFANLERHEREHKLAQAQKHARNEIEREKKRIENRKEERNRELDQMKQVQTSEPELLGALVVVPAKEL